MKPRLIYLLVISLVAFVMGLTGGVACNRGTGQVGPDSPWLEASTAAVGRPVKVRHRLYLAFPLLSSARHRLHLAFPLFSSARHTPFTLRFHCFRLQDTLPSPCVSTAFVCKTHCLSSRACRPGCRRAGWPRCCSSSTPVCSATRGRCANPRRRPRLFGSVETPVSVGGSAVD